MRRYHQLLAGASWMRYATPTSRGGEYISATHLPDVRAGMNTRACSSPPRPRDEPRHRATPKDVARMLEQGTTSSTTRTSKAATAVREQRAAGHMNGAGVFVPAGSSCGYSAVVTQHGQPAPCWLYDVVQPSETRGSGLSALVTSLTTPANPAARTSVPRRRW